MADEPNQTILIKYIVEAQQAITATKELDAATNNLKTTAKSGGFQAIADGIRQEGIAVGWSKQQINDAINAKKQKFQELNTSVAQTKQSFSSLGSVITRFLGIGFVLAQVRNLINFLKEASQSGYEFAKGMYQLSVGVNALRRAGTDITFGDVLEQLQKLKSEFGIFATKDLVVGASAFLNLNRDMGFTKEQLFSLQEAVATLAVVNGRAMDEVQKTVALALSSGYTEGLQRLGVSINRVTIAGEAARIGWDKGYTALTEQQRALATYNLILRKTAVYSDDLLKYQKTLPGQIDTTTASIIDATAKLGEQTLSIQLIFVKIKLAFVNLVEFFYGSSFKLIKFLVDFADNAREIARLTPFEPIIESVGKLIDKFKELNNVTPKPGWARGFLELIPGMDKLLEFGDKLADILNKKIAVKAPAITPPEGGLTTEQIQMIESAGDKILDLEKQLANDRRDLETDLQRDLAKIEEDGKHEIYEINLAHGEKLLNIQKKYDDDIKSAQDKYDLDISQTWDDYYSNMASAAEKHSNKLLKVEEDFQEKLKRLKEGFLLDLEDALQKRDARQVLQLIRRYNLEKTQATRERDQNQKEEERNYKEQLSDLDRQKKERLKKLKEEFALRNAAIVKQRDDELAAEKESYRQKLVAQMVQDIVDRKNRAKKYKEDLDDLQTHFDDRMKLIAKDLEELGITTETGLQAVIDAMNAYVGPGGAADAVLGYFVASVQATMAAAAAAMAMFSGKMITYPGGKPLEKSTPINPFKNPKAEGGLEIATKPTAAVFGEKEPELALFLPLSKISGLSSASKAPLSEIKTGAGGGKGKAQIEILLGAGLEGKIIDQALGDVADIVIKRIRQ